MGAFCCYFTGMNPKKCQVTEDECQVSLSFSLLRSYLLLTLVLLPSDFSLSKEFDLFICNTCKSHRYSKHMNSNKLFSEHRLLLNVTLWRPVQRALQRHLASRSYGEANRLAKSRA